MMGLVCLPDCCRWKPARAVIPPNFVELAKLYRIDDDTPPPNEGDGCDEYNMVVEMG